MTSNNPEEFADDTVPPYVPALLGEFKPLRCVHQHASGQGTVLLARNTLDQELVAIKVLKSDLSTASSSLARFRREVEVLEKLDHPGICKFLTSDLNAIAPYFVMEYITGDPLTSRTGATSHESDAALLASITRMEKVTRALEYLHKNDIVHRDIKPANIVVREDGEPILVDFGLASDEQAMALTMTGAVMGTRPYMSPEQTRGSGINHRTDIYSVGATLYELVTGETPFGRYLSNQSIVEAICHDAVPRKKLEDSTCPHDLITVIERAMEKDPSQRYQSAAELADDLGRIVAKSKVRARPIHPLRRARRWISRHPRTLIVSGCLLLISATGGAVFGIFRQDIELAKSVERQRSIDDHLADLAQEIMLNRIEEVPAHARRILALDSQHLEATVHLAIAYHRMGNNSEALQALRTIDRSHDRPELQLVWSALEGETVTTDCLSSSQDSALVSYFHGNLALTKNDYESALKQFQSATQLSPQARRHYWYARAYAAAKAKDETACRATARYMTGLWPQTAGIQWCAAFALSGWDRDAAIRHYRLALGIERHSHTLHNLAVMISLSEPEEAASLYQEAIAHNPSAMKSQAGLARTLLKLQRRDEAIRVLREAESQGFNQEIQALLGVALVAKGERKAGFEAIKRGTDAGTTWSNPYFMLARKQIDERSPGLALDTLRNAFKSISPRTPADTRVLALMFAELGKVEEGIQLMLSLGEQHAKNEHDFYALTTLYVESQQGEKALESVKSLLDLNPDHLAGIGYQALLMAQYRKPKEALPFLEVAVEKDPKNFNLLMTLSFAYMATAQFSKAGELRRRAKALKPTRSKSNQSR
ncbi:MAG: protein kinase [Planctomycetota bacterium]